MELMPLLSRVFDSEMNIKLCGRDACIELIEYLSDKFPYKDFGNKYTGMLNIKSIKEVLD